jgi:hypothetical protein
MKGPAGAKNKMIVKDSLNFSVKKIEEKKKILDQYYLSLCLDKFVRQGNSAFL